MVRVVGEFDHQPAQRALDVGLGHTRNSAYGFLDGGRVFVPAGEWQQGVEVQMQSLPAVPAHRRRDRGGRAVGGAVQPYCPARRLGHRLNDGAREFGDRAGQRLQRAGGPRRSRHPGPYDLRGSAGHTSDDAGNAGNLHSSPFDYVYRA